MKKKISYIIMSALFFNIMFIFLYYFKIVSYLYINIFNVNKYVNVLFNNLFIIVMDVIFILLYEIFNLEKFSYFLMCLVGIILGVIVSLLFFRDSKEFSDYLAIISYSVINTIFLAYSLYFEKSEEKVFL